MRWSGPAAMLAGVLGVGKWLRDGLATPPYSATLVDALAFVIPLLGLLGLAGLAAHVAAPLGRLGWSSAILGAVGLALAATGRLLREGLGVTAVGWPLVFVGSLATAVGLVLVGLAAMRVGRLRRWAVAPIMIGVLELVGWLGAGWGSTQFLLGMVASLGWVALGYALWSAQDVGDRAGVPQPVPDDRQG